MIPARYVAAKAELDVVCVNSWCGSRQTVSNRELKRKTDQKKK
ncbi:hypothetical protein [Niabella beijingensis]|nr:hypothetical protein [Niabella beijingensis]